MISHQSRLPLVLTVEMGYGHMRAAHAIAESFGTEIAQTDLPPYCDADILWTQPSELSFYAALGIPLVFAWPVGHHERCNRRNTVEAGAGFKQGNPSFAGQWIRDWLKDGTLAGAAWSGFIRLPKFGVYRIREIVGDKKVSG